MFEKIIPSTGKTHQQDLPIVVTLKRCTKGAMRSSFRRAPCTYTSISKKLTEMQSLNSLFQVLAKFISKTFPK